MKHYVETTLILVLAVLTLAVGCVKNETGDGAPGERSPGSSEDRSGVYHGVLPCASCPGIDVWVELIDTGDGVSFRMAESYLEEKDAVFVSEGTTQWLGDGSVVRLDLKGGASNYLVKEDSLFLLGESLDPAKADSVYRLQKTKVFSNVRERLFVPGKMIASFRKQGQKHVIIKDGVINFHEQMQGGHLSLTADIAINCQTRKYSLPKVAYYRQLFSQGELLHREDDNWINWTPFTGEDDVIAQAAALYCK